MIEDMDTIEVIEDDPRERAPKDSQRLFLKASRPAQAGLQQLSPVWNFNFARKSRF